LTNYYRYKCKDSADGIAVIVGNGTEEGSDDRDIAYTCTAEGKYDIPTKQGKVNLAKCLPRRKFMSRI